MKDIYLRCCLFLSSEKDIMISVFADCFVDCSWGLVAFNVIYRKCICILTKRSIKWSSSIDAGISFLLMVISSAL